jgi:hypothetical protein
MATVSVALPRARSARLWATLAFAAACLSSAALYGWMRAGVAPELHAPFARWCADLLEPGDWQCRLTASDFLWTYAGGSLFVWLGLALPGVVLAASGRRFSSVVPALLGAAGALATAVLAVPGGSPQPFGISETLFGNVAGAFWVVHTEGAIAVDLLLVTVPALAVAFVNRPPRRARPVDLPRHAVWASTIVVGGVIAAIRMVWHDVANEYLMAAFDVTISMAVMALFGAMLGADRRWWPWALVPVAVLLSLGPAGAVMSIPTELTAFTWFGDSVPLFAVGFVGSLWRPLATWFSSRRIGRTTAGEPSRRRTSPVRPVVLMNGLAAAALVTSVFAARFDPLGIQIATSLPTYLGARELAQDVRIKANLMWAIDAMDAYRTEHGTYAGFDAAAGAATERALAWSDDGPDEELVVRITEASDTTAQVVAHSASGRVFCAQRVGTSVTFGQADTLALARAACATSPLDGAALNVFDIETFCDDVDDGALLLCRSVQRLMREVLAASRPA